MELLESVFVGSRQALRCFVPLVPVGEWQWLQRIEGTSLISLAVVSIPTAPTKPALLMPRIVVLPPRADHDRKPFISSPRENRAP